MELPGATVPKWCAKAAFTCAKDTIQCALEALRKIALQSPGTAAPHKQEQPALSPEVR